MQLVYHFSHCTCNDILSTVDKTTKYFYFCSSASLLGKENQNFLPFQHWLNDPKWHMPRGVSVWQDSAVLYPRQLPLGAKFPALGYMCKFSIDAFPDESKICLFLATISTYKVLILSVFLITCQSSDSVSASIPLTSHKNARLLNWLFAGLRGILSEIQGNQTFRFQLLITSHFLRK